MSIYRGDGGSVAGLTESEVTLIAISQGGTGANNVVTARSNLGLGTAATTDASAYATAAQGAKADTATQPGDLGTAAAEDVGYFATAAQGALADSAVQPADLATVATTGSYNDLTDKPTAGSGTVTSVGMTVPTGLAVSGSPVTTTGTLAVTYATGYAIPTTAKQTNWDTAYGWGNHATAGYLTTETYTGTVTSVAMTVPTGLSVSGTPITSTGTLAVTLTAGYSIPTTSSQTNWDTAYTDRLKWDGGSTGLTASTGRTSLGATTVGSNLFTLTNPSAITFVRLNADNTVSALNASDFRTAIGAGTSSTTGTVTSVSGTGTVNGLSLSGTVTSSGSLTLGGTLDLSSPPAIGGTTAAAVTGTVVTASTKFVSSYFDASGSGGGALRNASGTAQLQWGGGGGNNITFDVAANLNPANSQIDISPTGTGTVRINPATLSSMNNVTIGATTPAAITGTTITATTYAGGNTSNWNTAFGWGNHASAGYLTSASTLDASKLSGTIDGGTY